MTTVDTLLANFPKGSVVAIIDDPRVYIGVPPVCPLPSDRSFLRAYMRTLHAMARADKTTVVVVCPAAKDGQPAGLYSIPIDISTMADVVVCPHADGGHTVLKNRFGPQYRVFPTIPIPDPPNLIPESSMTNDEINASSASLPLGATPEQTARFMSRVYAWLGAGVATSAGAAYLVAQNPDTHAALTSGATGVCVLLAPFALIGLLGFTTYKGRRGLTAAAYLLLTALIGVTMSSIVVKATGNPAFAGDVVAALVVSAGMFAGLAVVGHTIKRDLSNWGTFLCASLWGLILAMIANVFIGSTEFQFAISGVGVLLFSVLITYDVQRAKHAAVMGEGGAVLCALSLYLDVLNLFNFVLAMLGMSSREE